MVITRPALALPLALLSLSEAFGQASASPDIAIDHIEFVQVVQDRDNRVPLSAGKTTVARVFLIGTENSGQDITAGISGSLTASGFSEVLRPFSHPDTKLGAIAAAAPDQNNQRHSLNFLLPPAWTHPGALQVRASVTLNSGPPKIQTASATFAASPSWPPVFRIWRLEVCAPDVVGARQCPPDTGDVSELMQKIYPLADGAIEYNPAPAGPFVWSERLDSSAEQLRFTRFLALYYFLLERPEPVDQLFAWIPSSGGVSGLADFTAARSGGLSHIWWSASTCPDPCDRRLPGANMARAIAYNLGLRDGADSVAGGFDAKAGRVIPSSTPDLMTGFGPWASAATFQALFNANAIPFTSEPTEYLVIGGALTPDGSLAQLDPGYRVLSARPGDPSSAEGTHCLRFSGGEPVDYCFSPLFADPSDPTSAGGFAVKAPFPPGTTRVALISRDPAAGDIELTALTASAEAPVLGIVSPSPGDAWQGARTIQWTASDPGGSPLVYAVQYSADNGASWVPLAIDLKDTQLDVDGTRINGSSQVIFRVLASNGLVTTMASVGPITVSQSPKLSLNPAALDFRNVTVGQSADITFTLSNTGTGPLTAAGQVSGSGYSLLLGAGALVIPSGAQRAITVRWSPTSSGSQPGALTVTSSDPSLSRVNVPLSGVAFDNPVPSIGLSAASIDFGSVTSGQSRDLKFTVANGGVAALTVTSINSTNARFIVLSPALPLTIAAGQAQDVTVRFAPNAAGVFSGGLSISSNDPTRGAITITLAGTGASVSIQPSLSVAPAALDFGGVTTGQTSDSKLTISNTGAADLSVRSISTNAAVFSVVSPAAPFTVSAGRSIDVTVRFTPSATGLASAALIISSSDPVRPTLTMLLTGSGVAPASSTVLRTIAYHEFTSLTSRIDIYNIPVISRSGNRAAFTVRSSEVWVVNPDGSGLRQIDTFTFPNARFLSLSEDGSKVLVWNSQFLRIANADGSPARTLLTDNNEPTIQAARLSADGRTIVFVNSLNATLLFSGGTKIAEPGVWAINSDGTNLRGLASVTDVSGLLGGDSVRTVADSAFPGEMDISANGSRIVFGVVTGRRGRCLLGVNGDGSGLHIIRASLVNLLASAISGDGSTVAYTATPYLGAPLEVDVIRFDGTGGLTLSAQVGANSLQVNHDGSLVFAGGFGSGLLWRSDGSSLVELFSPLWGGGAQLASESGDFNRASMNGDGSRFLFTVSDSRYAQNGLIQLATAEINPASLGAAPSISGATIDPLSIPGDGKGYSALVSGKVTSATPLVAVSAQSFLQGLPDQAGTALSDAGDGAWIGSIYFSTSIAGPRVTRIKAETQSPDGKRHATAIDIGGFTVGAR